MSNYIDKVWAENGQTSDIPVDAQGSGVSYDQGYTDLYERDVATDPTALSISRTNMNGLFKKITANLKQWLGQCYPDYYQFDNSGNPVEYKIYSAVRYQDGVYLSKVNNNTALPTDTAKWSLFQTLDFATEAEAIARTATDKWMSPFVSGKLIDNELIGNIPKSAISLALEDLDNITTAGFYYQSSNSNTAGNNYPKNYAGSLDVKISENGISQTYIVSSNATSNSNKIYVRGKYNGVWSSWKDIGGGTDTINPVGSIIMVASNDVPEGYLITDQSSVSRTVYSRLFAEIGTLYGAGDGSTTFNLPGFDLSGAFLRGSGGSAGALGVLQGDAIRNIVGGVVALSDSGISGIISSAQGAMDTNGVSKVFNMGGTRAGSRYSGFNFNASNVVPTANENRPRNYAVKICIKY